MLAKHSTKPGSIALKVAMILVAAVAAFLFTGCAAKTTPATDVTSTTATLHAEVGWEKGEVINWWFETRALGTTQWARTPVRGPFDSSSTNSASGIVISETVSGLTPSTTYQYRICGYLKLAKGQQAGSANNPICLDKNGNGGGSWSQLRTLDPVVPGGETWPLYSPTSPFNTKLTAQRKTQISPNSTTAVANWVQSYRQNSSNAPHFTVGQGGTRDDWDHPIYYAKASDPKFTVQYTSGWGNGNGAQGQSIPIPAQAKPSGSDDDHLAVITPDGWEYDFWQADAPANGVIRATYGGRTRVDGDGLRVAATESHFALGAGVIAPEELAAGQINHALFMVIRTSDGTTVWPAEPQPHATQPGMPPYGAHFYLDYTDQEINNAPWPAWKKAIVRAAANYGFYFGDTGGGSLKTKSGVSYTALGQPDPWIKVAQQYGIPNHPWGGHPSYNFDMVSGVDWAGRTRMLVPAKPGF